MKYCTGCEESKDKSEFYKDNTHKDGLRTHCISCVSLQRKGKFVSITRPVRDNTTEDVFNQCFIEECLNKIHGRGMCSIHYNAWLRSNDSRETRERIVCSDCGIPFSSPSNRGPIPGRCADCAEEFESMWKLAWNRSKGNRARKSNAPVLQDIDLQLLYDVFNGCCYLCGDSVDHGGWHLEHIVPLSKGGSHSYSNLAVSCQPCNNKKCAKQLWEVIYGA